MTALLVAVGVVAAFLVLFPMLAVIGVQPFGPLYQHELLRLSRTGKLLTWRTLLVFTLLAALAMQYAQAFSPTLAGSFTQMRDVQPAESQRLAENYLWKFLWIQQVAAILLAPVYLGGAIAEEKERKSWDFLLSAPLTAWQLLLGKFTARLTHVLDVLATGLPVLALTLLFGGVNPTLVLQGLLISVLTVLSLGSISLWIGIHRPRVRDVLLWLYGGLGIALLIVTALCGVFNTWWMHPISVIWFLRDADIKQTYAPMDVLVVYAGVHGTLALVFMILAWRQVRTAGGVKQPAIRVQEPDAPRPKPAKMVMEDEAAPEWYRQQLRAIPLGDRVVIPQGRTNVVPTLTDRDDPLLWTEKYFASTLPVLEGKFARTLRGCFLGFIAFVLGASMCVIVLFSKMSGEIGAVLHFLVNAALLFLTPSVGLRVALGLSEERSRRTLVDLFLLPDRRWRILRAKCIAALYGFRFIAASYAVVMIFTLCTGGVTFHRFLLAVMLQAAWLVLNLGVGLGMGAWARTGLQALLSYLGVIFLLAVLPLFFANWNLADTALAPLTTFYKGLLTSSSYQKTELFDPQIEFESLLSCSVYSMAGFVLAYLASKKFAQEGRI